jgi:hypothetical protein
LLVSFVLSIIISGGGCMDSFTIQIAGMNACVQPLFASTREYCRGYLTDLQPDFYLEVTAQDLVDTQRVLEAEAIEEGIRPRKFPDPFLERATIQRKIAAQLISRDTLLLHGSTVGLDGNAYLFTAPCGTGKSTHTRLWREVFGRRAVMVNDDKPFLRISASGVMACGSPWSGKHGLDSNICLPLKGICFLKRGKENRIRPISSEECFDALCAQCYIPEDASLRRNAISLLKTLPMIVPLWEMECTKDPAAAHVSYEAMSGLL